LHNILPIFLAQTFIIKKSYLETNFDFMNKISIYTLLLFLGFILLNTGCAKIQEPKFVGINGMHIVSLGLKKTVIGLNMVYFNPNNFGVSVKEAEAKIYIDSTYIGDFIQKGVTSITKEAQFSVPMEGTIPLQAAIEANLPALAGKEVLISAKGSVKIGKGGVFITKQVSYSGRHVLDLNLIKNPAGAGF